MKEMVNIYQHLQDEVSQKIFSNRLLYNITSEQKYLENIINVMIEHSKITTKLYSVLEKVKKNKKKVIIYGAGGAGKAFGNYLERLDIPVEAFCDSSTVKQKQRICLMRGEKQILSLEDTIYFYKNEYIMISINNPYYRKQVKDNLLQKDLKQEQIIEASDFFGKQYFDETIPFPKERLPKEKIFVDAGCYDLGTALEYKNWIGGECFHLSQMIIVIKNVWSCINY